MTCIVRAIVAQDPDFGSEKLPEPMVLDLNGCSYSDPMHGYIGVQREVSQHHRRDCPEQGCLLRAVRCLYYNHSSRVGFLFARSMWRISSSMK